MIHTIFTSHGTFSLAFIVTIMHPRSYQLQPVKARLFSPEVLESSSLKAPRHWLESLALMALYAHRVLVEVLTLMKNTLAKNSIFDN